MAHVVVDENASWNRLSHKFSGVTNASESVPSADLCDPHVGLRLPGHSDRSQLRVGLAKWQAIAVMVLHALIEPDTTPKRCGAPLALAIERQCIWWPAFRRPGGAQERN